ncbi:hypothetical protein Vadar_001418 [Vaccinium darrowii]|uniref:Uncharacterized protein n=1 Tax=Vaccinium darrowii TaxID=229202 RepID=A0ACB7XFP5_9ERIC|nr:hypothetical protein Vadar_001418 [Vaccinium darrowii]
MKCILEPRALNLYPKLELSIELIFSSQSWYTGYYGYAKSKGQDVGVPVGLDVMIDGTVPTGSGLSSSAAFVCSSTIAIMAAFDVNFPKLTTEASGKTTYSPH